MQCLVVYVATGFDLRLLEAGEMLRTELFQDALMPERRARRWRQALTTTVGIDNRPKRIPGEYPRHHEFERGSCVSARMSHRREKATRL